VINYLRRQREENKEVIEMDVNTISIYNDKGTMICPEHNGMWNNGTMTPINIQTMPVLPQNIVITDVHRNEQVNIIALRVVGQFEFKSYVVHSSGHLRT